MELNWSTFLLEIINFLVLVWILKRFLYRPVLNIIEKRRHGIEQTLNEAKETHADAEALQQQYEGRLADWEREKQQARETLQQEIQAERNKLFDQLNLELDTEREKAAVVEQRHQTELQQHYQETALRQGANFAAKLLHAVATPELEKQLFELLLRELSQLPEKRIATLRQTCAQDLEKIVISSAFLLNTNQKQQLEQILQRFCESPMPFEYRQNDDLVAGLRITLGAWVLRMNLQDELSGFAALSDVKADA